MGGIVNHTQSGQYAAYVLAPQIDPSMWFQSYNGSPTEAMSLTIKALDQVIATHDIDTTRIYVTGVSMGAMGAWDILRWAPGRFAAAVPLSGYANPNTASAIKNVPIWAFHGSNDTIVPVSGSRNMIAALRAAGGNPKYTEIAGGGHVIWNPIYNDPSNTLYSWLFSQQLGAASASVPDAEPVSATKPKPVFSAKPVKVVKPKTPPTRKPATGLFSIAPTTRRSVARG
jgi:predicted peptidase